MISQFVVGGVINKSFGKARRKKLKTWFEKIIDYYSLTQCLTYT